jgi:hypothetical protein
MLEIPGSCISKRTGLNSSGQSPASKPTSQLQPVPVPLANVLMYTLTASHGRIEQSHIGQVVSHSLWRRGYDGTNLASKVSGPFQMDHGVLLANSCGMSSYLL